MTLFLDRDGVINRQREGDYVTSWEEFEFLPGVLEALAELASFCERIVVVTNQQGVGRSRMSLDDLEAIHRQMVKEIESHGGRLDGIYVCPHRADENCNCRKPKPGLLLRASQEQGISLQEAWFVGDSARDVVAGARAGCRTILVGERRDTERAWAAAQGATPTAEAESLAEAVSLLRRFFEEGAR